MTVAAKIWCWRGFRRQARFRRTRPSAYSRNVSTVVVQCLQRLPLGNTKYTYSCDGYTFNFLLDSGFVFPVVADESVGRSVPFVFLETVKDDFKKRYGASIGNDSSILVFHYLYHLLFLGNNSLNGTLPDVKSSNLTNINLFVNNFTLGDIGNNGLPSVVTNPSLITPPPHPTLGFQPPPIRPCFLPLPLPVPSQSKG
ncbi:hypothetical protein L1987_30495 [Smallanthus sonchifolius]|uniref:Uncharacterized protein n=1 Tax=Smallanthus sonchifolius TaxID=185202 RepID=A0ACB9I3S1_9ASTR|nr:hypothetical protein L1987_30495 [Smallanthus sonchifolius]